MEYDMDLYAVKDMEYDMDLYAVKGSILPLII